MSTARPPQWVSSGESLYATLLKEFQLLQEKLAELADVHRNYVGGVERGERNVSLLNIVKLAHGLSVRPAKLIEPIR